MKQQIRLRQQPVTHEVGFWSTPSTTGELAFMNGMITAFEVQIDMEGNLSAREWRWGWEEILY
jgi:hypothetical protein